MSPTVTKPVMVPPPVTANSVTPVATAARALGVPINSPPRIRRPSCPRWVVMGSRPSRGYSTRDLEGEGRRAQGGAFGAARAPGLGYGTEGIRLTARCREHQCDGGTLRRSSGEVPDHH